MPVNIQKYFTQMVNGGKKGNELLYVKQNQT